MNETIEFDERDRLRAVLLVFLKFERIITVHGISENCDFETIEHPKMTTGLRTHQLNFLKLLKINVGDIDFDGMHENIAINNKISEILDEFVLLEIIVRVGDETSAFINTDGYHQAIENRSYKLSAKGLEVVLKLQEHNDNQKRIEQQVNISSEQVNISSEQVNISKSLKTNSDRALKVSIGALLLSVCFLIISNSVLKNTFDTIKIGKKQLQISQKQLKLSERRIELLESKGKENIISIPKKKVKKPD